MFSSNGRWLATAGGAEYKKDFDKESTVRLWDLVAANPGQASVVLSGHPVRVSSLAFSSDNQQLVSGCIDGTVIVWPVGDALLLDAARRCVGRNMSWDEWQQFLPDKEYRRTFKKLPIHPSVNVKRAQKFLDDALLYVFKNEMEQAKQAFGKSTELAVLTNNASLCSDICREGSIGGFALSVLDAGNRAVQLSPHSYDYRDSRGMALAMTGKLKKAIADFQAFVDNCTRNVSTEDLELRRAWIRALKRNEQPITKAVRALLK